MYNPRILLGGKFRPLCLYRVILTRCIARICSGSPCCATCVSAVCTLSLYINQVKRMVLITRKSLPIIKWNFHNYELTVTVYFLVLWVAHWPYNNRSLRELTHRSSAQTDVWSPLRLLIFVPVHGSDQNFSDKYQWCQ